MTMGVEYDTEIISWVIEHGLLTVAYERLWLSFIIAAISGKEDAALLSTTLSLRRSSRSLQDGVSNL